MFSLCPICATWQPGRSLARVVPLLTCHVSNPSASLPISSRKAAISFHRTLNQQPTGDSKHYPSTLPPTTCSTEDILHHSHPLHHPTRRCSDLVGFRVLCMLSYPLLPPFPPPPSLPSLCPSTAPPPPFPLLPSALSYPLSATHTLSSSPPTEHLISLDLTCSLCLHFFSPLSPFPLVCLPCHSPPPPLSLPPSALDDLLSATHILSSIPPEDARLDSSDRTEASDSGCDPVSTFCGALEVILRAPHNAAPLAPASACWI